MGPLAVSYGNSDPFLVEGESSSRHQRVQDLTAKVAKLKADRRACKKDANRSMDLLSPITKVALAVAMASCLVLVVATGAGPLALIPAVLLVSVCSLYLTCFLFLMAPIGVKAAIKQIQLMKAEHDLKKAQSAE